MYYKIIKQNRSFIHNEWVSSAGGEQLAVYDKYSGELLEKIPYLTSEQVAAAAKSSVGAFNILQELSCQQRQLLLNKVIKGLQSEAPFFADLIAREAGKPIQYAAQEVERCLSTLTFAAAEGPRFSGETIAMDYAAGVGKTALTKPMAIGPILAISPFNFPLNLALHKIAPALILGLPILLKPSPLAPLTSLAFARLVQEAGFPAGALNVAICDHTLAEKLVQDERFAMLSFTGSAKVGHHLRSLAGKKKVVLELGGNAGVIINDALDLPAVAKSVALGAYAYAGQICISTQRIIVQKKLYAKFKELLCGEIKLLKSGDPLQAHTVIGPLISKKELLRVDEWVQNAVATGAKIVCGGFTQASEHNIYAPTLLENTPTSAKIYRQEAFAPVATLEAYDDFSEAIERVNDSVYGLQAGVFSNNIDYMKIAHDKLQVGAVIMNHVPGFRVETMPYGGVKDSGLGREGIRYAMMEMTTPRLLVY